MVGVRKGQRVISSRPIPRRGQVKEAIIVGLVHSFLSLARRAAAPIPRFI